MLPDVNRYMGRYNYQDLHGIPNAVFRRQAILDMMSAHTKCFGDVDSRHCRWTF